MISTVEELIEHVEDPNDVHDESQLIGDELNEHLYDDRVYTLADSLYFRSMKQSLTMFPWSPKKKAIINSKFPRCH